LQLYYKKYCMCTCICKLMDLGLNCFTEKSYFICGILDKKLCCVIDLFFGSLECVDATIYGKATGL